MPKDDACLIDSSIAFARSSSSLEISLASFLERAIASATSSSSLTGVLLTSFSNLGDELLGILGEVEIGGGGRTNKCCAAASNGGA